MLNYYKSKSGQPCSTYPSMYESFWINLLIAPIASLLRILFYHGGIYPAICASHSVEILLEGEGSFEAAGYIPIHPYSFLFFFSFSLDDCALCLLSLFDFFGEPLWASFPMTRTGILKDYSGRAPSL